jgi:hypothetical protein
VSALQRTRAALAIETDPTARAYLLGRLAALEAQARSAS